MVARDRLVALLEALHLGADSRRRSTGSAMLTGQLGEHRRDLVVVGAALGRRADRDGHHRAHDAALDGLAAREQQVAEAAGDHGEHDVVDGAAVLGADRLDVGQAPARPGPAAVRPDRPVERRPRRRPQQRAQARDGAGDLGRLARRPARRARRRPQAARALVRDLRPVRQRRADDARGARLRRRLPGRGISAGGARRSESKTTLSRSVPETPSTMQWCILVTSAQRPSPSPSATHISHSGFERSSFCAITRPTRLRSSSSPPGAGSAVRRTWYSRWKCGVVHPDRAGERERREAHALAVARDRGEAWPRSRRGPCPASARGPRRCPPSRCACGSPRPRRAGTRHRARSSSPCREACPNARRRADRRDGARPPPLGRGPAAAGDGARRGAQPGSRGRTISTLQVARSTTRSTTPPMIRRASLPRSPRRRRSATRSPRRRRRR